MLNQTSDIGELPNRQQRCAVPAFRQRQCREAGLYAFRSTRWRRDIRCDVQRRNRVIIAVFASNFNRIQQVIDAALQTAGSLQFQGKYFGDTPAGDETRVCHGR
ncbi:hypothetical protein PO124_00230 [Bacillus licheniformis]|nr:hypothetical protein [Bacillus licheniformis]